jgi:hypothetical protein
LEWKTITRRDDIRINSFESEYFYTGAVNVRSCSNKGRVKNDTGVTRINYRLPTVKREA